MAKLSGFMSLSSTNRLLSFLFLFNLFCLFGNRTFGLLAAIVQTTKLLS